MTQPLPSSVCLCTRCQFNSCAGFNPTVRPIAARGRAVANFKMRTNAAWTQNETGTFFSAIGAWLSLLQRSGQAELNLAAGRRIHRIEGFVRVANRCLGSQVRGVTAARQVHHAQAQRRSVAIIDLVGQEPE
jgi:hypothetical protein